MNGLILFSNYMFKTTQLVSTILLWAVTSVLFGQTGLITDSLKQELSKASTDLDRANLHLLIATDIIYVDLQAALKHIDTLNELAGKLENDDLIRKAKYNYSVIYRLQGDYNKAMELQKEYASDIEKTTDTLEIAKAYYQLGAINVRLDQYDEGSEHLRKALSYAESIPDYSLAFKILNAIGIIYKNLGQHSQALNVYKKAIDYCFLEKDTASLAILYNSIGILYNHMDSVPQALDHFEKGLAIAERVGNLAAVASQSRNIGLIHLNNQDLDLAEEYYEKSLEIRLKQKSKLQIGGSYSDLGEVFLLKGDLVKAEQYLTDALTVFQEIGALISENYIYSQLSRLYAAKGAFKESNEYLNQYYTIKDSLENNELREKITELDIKYETVKKDSEIAAQQLIINQQASQRNLLLIGAATLLCVAWFLFYRNRKNNLLANSKIENLEKQQKLLALDYMVQGQEEERKRIAQDLHDGLGGMLTSVRHQVRAIQDQINALTKVDLIGNTEQLIEKACDEVRRISHDMMPASLVSLGLIDAIEDLVNEIRAKSSFEVKLTHEGNFDNIADKAKVNIYRIIQEITNNTIKHSGARFLSISLSQRDQTIYLNISDDGSGFDYETAKEKGGIGLKSIESRVQYLEGAVKAESNDGGTTYEIEIPI